jgi:hypothetical protein
MPSVQELEAAIRACTVERQALHERGAASDELERNRLELVRLQRQLAQAWIDLRLGETGPAAA